jgi:hypothetical protein
VKDDKLKERRNSVIKTNLTRERDDLEFQSASDIS